MSISRIFLNGAKSTTIFMIYPVVSSQELQMVLTNHNENSIVSNITEQHVNRFGIYADRFMKGSPRDHQRGAGCVRMK